MDPQATTTAALGLVGALAACNPAEATPEREPVTEAQAIEVAEAVGPLLREGPGSEMVAMQLATDVSRGETWLSPTEDGAWRGESSTARFALQATCFDGKLDPAACSVGTKMSRVVAESEVDVAEPQLDTSFRREATWTVEQVDTRTPRVTGGAYTEVWTTSQEGDQARPQRRERLGLYGGYDLTSTGEPHAFVGTITWNAVSRSVDTSVEVVLLGEGPATMVIDGTWSFEVDADGRVYATY